jgi:hypothetical protein
MFEPTKALVNHPSPRTWSYIGGFLSRGVIDHELYEGAVGRGAAVEFISFLEMAKNAPSIDDIIANPHKAPIPNEPSMLYLVTCGLAARSTQTNFGQIFKYLSRLSQQFRVFAIKDSVRRTIEITKTQVFRDWMLNEGREVMMSVSKNK